ncbi:MAG: YmdB family metallophosphoesterase [Oscillospiraceae bacterium]|nr:YmdB family metallophosphoesterase [Oscillospiraceae bacterium]
MKILAIGDVVSERGVAFLEKRLRAIKKSEGIDFTVVNGENAASVGLTRNDAEDILAAGADVITLGNHAFRRREVFDFLDDSPYILRPANFASQTPGRGVGVYEAAGRRIRVINLIGRCNMEFGPDNPFTLADKILKDEVDITLVDFHCEATSEKLAMAYHLDGRVTALWGTHTHVQTADEEVFPGGMGYITDLGMTGPVRSVIGIEPQLSVDRFLGNPPAPYKAAKGQMKLEGVIFEVGGDGRCTGVRRLRILD